MITRYVIQRRCDGRPMMHLAAELYYQDKAKAERDLKATTARPEIWEIVEVEVQRKETVR